jgi:SnoaL-like protein
MKTVMKAAALVSALALSTAVPAQPTRNSDVIERFNQAFQRHDASLLEGLVAEDCVMESVEPAPDGTRIVGREANLKFWQNLRRFVFFDDTCGNFIVLLQSKPIFLESTFSSSGRSPLAYSTASHSQCQRVLFRAIEPSGQSGSYCGCDKVASRNERTTPSLPDPDHANRRGDIS